MKRFLVVFLLCTASVFASPRMRTGTYLLSGGNSKWSGGGYQGEVTIYPQGENYRLVWQIGHQQTQMGVGILYNNILSVAYLDLGTNVWGVASFRLVGDGEFEGRWTSYDGTIQKPEYLVWKGY